MSRLSNKRVLLEVDTGGLVASLSSRWPRPKALARVQQKWVAAPPGAPAGTPHGWQAAFAPTLDRVLGELSPGASLRAAVLDVELTDTLVHFDVAEGDFSGHSELELAGVTRACINDLLGEPDAPQALRWQLQADERHLLMCALPQSLIEAVTSGATRHGLRLQGVQPRFPVRWNRLHRVMRTGLGVFASGHDEHAVIAVVRDGIVEALGAGSCPADLEDAQSPAPSVDRLLNNLGLEKTATPTRLDAQVDRLIASLGIDAKQLQHFVVVDEGRNGQALSSRWQLFEHEGSGA